MKITDEMEAQEVPPAVRYVLKDATRLLRRLADALAAAPVSASGSSKEMEELQALAGELRDSSKWRVSSAQRTILLNAADAVAALWHIKSADAIASRSATGRGTDG